MQCNAMPEIANCHFLIRVWADNGKVCCEEDFIHLFEPSLVLELNSNSVLEDNKKLRARLAEAEAQRDVLVEFVKEYLDAWKNGMASDSYLLRMAREALAKLEEK